MIFDRKHVEELLLEWLETQDEDTLAEILEKSTSLIEAIVSGYDSTHRHDLIQEAYYRVQYALPKYNSDIGNLHTYLTTVIHNVCRTYMTKTNKIPIVEIAGDLEDDEDYDILGFTSEDDVSEDDIIHKEILGHVVEYMRQRFPSLSVEHIDYMCQTIVWSLFHNAGTQRTVISNIVEKLEKLDRKQITVFYNSVMICVRVMMIEAPNFEYDDVDEFSILRDLYDVVGKEAYNKLSVIFRGIPIRFPK